DRSHRPLLTGSHKPCAKERCRPTPAQGLGPFARLRPAKRSGQLPTREDPELKHVRLITNALLIAICIPAVGPFGAQAADGVAIFATGFNNPRGLKFGPDGYLYVAEAGLGGTNSTIGQRPQVPTPPGPYTGGRTARISKVDPNGQRTTVADRLPSAG